MRAALTHVSHYLPFALVIALFAAMMPPEGNDFFQFWYAGHLVATGRSPYDPAAWSDAGRYGGIADIVMLNCTPPDAAACLWLYPPWTAWLYAPFAWLDPHAGVVAIAFFSLAAITIGLLLAARSFGGPPGWRGSLMLAALAASAPVERTAIGGHFLGVTLSGLAVLNDALRTRRPLWFASASVALALKIHVVVALPVLVAWEMVRARAWRSIVAGAAVVAALALAAVTDRRVVPALIGEGVTKITGLRENGAVLVQPAPDRLAAAAALVVIALAAGWLIEINARPRRRVSSLIAVGAGVSILVTPYMHSYDHMVLIPAVVLATGVAGARWSIAIPLGFLVLTWASYLLELAQSPYAFSALLPVATLVVLAAVARVDQERQPAARQGERPATVLVHQARRRLTPHSP